MDALLPALIFLVWCVAIGLAINLFLLLLEDDKLPIKSLRLPKRGDIVRFGDKYAVRANGWSFGWLGPRYVDMNEPWISWGKEYAGKYCLADTLDEARKIAAYVRTGGEFVE